MSISTARLKPDKVKKVLPAPAAKPERKTVSTSNGNLRYQAIGIVQGILVITPRSVYIETPTGDRLKIRQLRDQRLLMWLLSNAELWQGKLGDWTVYPSSNGFTLAFANQPSELNPGQFKITGHCRALPDEAIGVLVRRNDSRNKDFSVVNVEGQLPNLVDGQMWRLNCELQGDRLVLVEGQLWSDEQNN